MGQRKDRGCTNCKRNSMHFAQVKSLFSSYMSGFQNVEMPMKQTCLHHNFSKSTATDTSKIAFFAELCAFYY